MAQNHAVVDENGIVTNIIVADEYFAAKIGALPVSEGQCLGVEYAPPTPETDENSLREQIADNSAAINLLLNVVADLYPQEVQSRIAEMGIDSDALSRISVITVEKTKG